MNQKEYSSPLSLRKVQVTDEFWKNEMELVRKEVIPYQWEALNDRIPDADPSFSMRNFKVAGRLNARRKAEGDAYRPVKWPLEFQPLPVLRLPVSGQRLFQMDRGGGLFPYPASGPGTGSDGG